MAVKSTRVKRHIKQTLMVLGCMPMLAQSQLQAWGDYPVLPKQVENAPAFGERLGDPYSFLESLSDLQVRSWMKKQTDFTNAALARITGRDALLKRLRQLQGMEFGAGNLVEMHGIQFFVGSAPDGRSRLFMRNAVTGAEKVLLLAETGQAINFFSPSLDANYVAVDIVKSNSSGRQQHNLRIIKGNDTTMLKDNLESVAVDAKNVTWKSDSTTIYYRRAPNKPGAGKGAIWQHVLGSKADTDIAVIGPAVSKSRQFAATDVLTLKSSANSNYMLAEVQHGANLERSLYLIRQDQLKGAASPWIRLASPADKIRNAWLAEEQLYVLSAKKKTTGSILRLDLKTPQISAAQEILSASSDELLDMAIAKDGLYIHAVDDGYSKLLKTELNGGKKQELPLPYAGRISQMNADMDTEGALFVLEAANAAPLSYRALAGGQIKNVEVYRSPQVGFHRISSRNLLISKPGGDKQFALTLLYPEGLELDGQHPCLLTLETGTGLAKLTKFDALRMAWLEQGAVMAIVYTSSGSARLVGQKKPVPGTGVDELLAAADYLVSEGYTNPKKLVLQEAGAGKQLIAQALSQRPELFAAAQSAGLLSETMAPASKKSPQKNRKNPETGNSPYLDLREGMAYPATLLTARFGIGDAPVWMSSKFTARLQATNTNKARPAFFRTDFANPWKSDALSEQADNWAFLLWQTGHKGFTVSPK